ncbi:MAG: DUF1194 domain-containing protein [Gammaproteobacteria bacterium]|nr:DUF1194 domain-containing protein [Gammaproteobacteria bacterium]
MHIRTLPVLAAATILGTLCRPANADTLELALVIDGSSSIAPADWTLQIGAYQSIFQDAFYTNFIAPSPWDDIVVGAFVFSGGTITITSGGVPIGTETFAVASHLAWTHIDSDEDAFAFGAGFAGLPQPGGQTNTSAALSVAMNGGEVGCINPAICNVSPKSTRPGLLDNGFTGDKLVIDISTDGVPTLPNGAGTPNAADRALAIAAANAARASGITINAIGVGNLDATFLAALVGTDPAAEPAGFFLTAGNFNEFEAALREKVGRETMVPVTPALPLALTAFGAVFAWCRRRRAEHTSCADTSAGHYPASACASSGLMVLAHGATRSS